MSAQTEHSRLSTPTHHQGAFARRQLPEKCKMQRWRLIDRGNTHQAANRQADRTAIADKIIELSRYYARLLLLFSGIDLNKTGQYPLLLFHFCHKRISELFPVHGFNTVKQRNGLLDLVGLQRADKVEADLPPHPPRKRGGIGLISRKRGGIY
mgnify:CR=1 FL=1